MPSVPSPFGQNEQNTRAVQGGVADGGVKGEQVGVGDRAAADVPNGELDARADAGRRSGRAVADASDGARFQRPERRPRSRYIPALDGIRTLAVAFVVLYHINPVFAPGGMQGVTIFFVLSGYLITHLLLIEFDGTGRIDLKDFWKRRLRRLVPATVVVVVVTAALCTLLNHVMLTKMRPDIIPSLLYLNNWWQIFNNMSYFSAVGDPSPLTHFWSLAIEAQFYLVWPGLLLLALRGGKSRTSIRRAVLVLAALSALEMALLYNPAVDPSRVYYGTDTRVFSLLLGAWLAFIPLQAVPERLELAAAHFKQTSGKQLGHVTHGLRAARTKQPAPTMRKTQPANTPRIPSANLLDVLGALGLLGTFLLVLFTNGYTAFPYRGGILLASLFAVMLVAACAHPESNLAKLFGLKPLAWLGQRSYGIYLWHYPLLLLMNPVSDISEKPWWVYLIQVAIVVAVSAISYRVIETPFRHGALSSFLQRVSGNRRELGAWMKRNAILLAACCAVTLVAIGGLVFVPDTSALSEEGAAMLQGGDSGEQGGSEVVIKDGSADDGSAVDSSGFPENAYDVTMLGDSVSLRAVDVFQQTFEHGYIDAQMNRQFTTGTEIYRSMLDQNMCGRVAVFALGTNGPISDAQIDELMGLVGDKRIAVFVNNRCPQPWIVPNNEVFARAAERYKNAILIDWYSYSANNNALFDGDGTHLSSEGAQAYVQLIYDTVKPYLPIHLDDTDDPRLLAAQHVLDSMRNAAKLDLPTIKIEEK